MPVSRLMGGPHRERRRVYWSHCASYRVENWRFGKPPLRTMADVAAAAAEAAQAGYTALKTNIIWPGEPARRIHQGRLGPHDQLATGEIIAQTVAQIGAMREAVGRGRWSPSTSSGWRSTTRTPTRWPISSGRRGCRSARASSG